MNIRLPWPARSLHPNSRSHWRVRAAAAKTSRNDAFLLTRCSMGRGCPAIDATGKVYLRLTFCPPNNHKHDIDGCLSANKSALDGIADALGVDDSRFSLTLERGPVCDGGAVYVQVYV